MKTLVNPAVELAERVCANGLRVVVSPDRTQSLVGVHLRYAAGSRHERPGGTGTAHLFEHLMFSGTERAPKGRHLRLVQSLGGNVNATTSTDWTAYYHVVPSGALDLILWLEADRLAHLPARLSQDTLDAERRVIHNERLMTVHNVPYGDAATRIAQAAFPAGHPYRHLPIGGEDDLEAATLADLRAFFAAFYVPDRAVLAVTGDVDPDRVFEQAEDYLGGVPRSAGDPGVRPAPRPVLDGVVERTAGTGLPPRLFVGLILPWSGSVEYEAHRLIAMLLGGGSGGLLTQRLGRDLGLVADVKIRLMAQAGGYSLCLVELVPQDGCDLDKLAEAYRRETVALAAAGPTAEQLERALALFTSRWLTRRDNVGSRADQLTALALAEGGAAGYGRVLGDLGALPAADLARLCSSWTGTDGSVLLRYTPDGGKDR